MPRAANLRAGRPAVVERPDITELFLLTRPYSWIDTILNLLVGLAWSGASYSGTLHVSGAGIALLLWFGLNWISEAIQHDPGRKPPRLVLAVGPLVVAGIWSVGLGGVRCLPWVMFYVALVFLYPWKARTAILGPVGPLLRGLQTATLFELGASIGPTPDGSRVRLFLAFMFIQTARSLIADVRDIQTDHYELPRIVGANAAKWIAAVVLATGIAVLPAIPPGHFEPQIILIMLFGVFVALRPLYSYEVHITSVLMFAFAKMALYTGLIHESQHLNWMMLASVQVILAVTYWHVPRASNTDFRDRISRAIRLIGDNSK